MVERYLRNPVVIIVLLLAVVAIVVYADVPGTVEQLVEDIRATDVPPPTKNPSELQRTEVAIQATQTALAQPTNTVVPTATASATFTATPSHTPTSTPTPTETHTPTLPPPPSFTSTPHCIIRPNINAFDPRLIPDYTNPEANGSIAILMPEGYDIIYVSSDSATFSGIATGRRVVIASEVALRVEGISFNYGDGHYNIWAEAFRGCTAGELFEHPDYGFDNATRALVFNAAGEVSEYPVPVPSPTPTPRAFCPGGAGTLIGVQVPQAPPTGCVLVTEWWVPPGPTPCGIIISYNVPNLPAGAQGTWYHVYPSRVSGHLAAFQARPDVQRADCEVEDRR